MNTCSFTYVTLSTYLPCRAMGIERTWVYLKKELDLQSDALPDPTARYFQTIGPGPDVFAVAGSSVYYHDEKQWCKFRTAFDIAFGTMEVPD